jgi:hypothetical protein
MRSEKRSIKSFGSSDGGLVDDRVYDTEHVLGTMI